MGTVGDALDNAVAESFFATLECELLDRRRFRTRTEARMAVFDYLEGFYAPRRRHSASCGRSAPRVVSSLARLRERLRGWLDENEVDDEVERGVVLAVSEAAANAVEHAYGCDGAGIVTVMARIDGERLDIAVRDEGTWSDDHGQADRGRGLSIMRAIVDELTVGRENGATVLRMSRAVREGAGSA